MKIYIALDCTIPILLHSVSNQMTQKKFRRALDLIFALLREFSTNSFDVELIQFSKVPRIVKKSAKDESDVNQSFPLNIVSSGKPDYLALRDLILQQNALTDFELVMLVDANNYNWVPPAFSQLPCPLRFVILADECHQGVNKSIIQSQQQMANGRDDIRELVLNRDEDVQAHARVLGDIPRVHKFAKLVISPSQTIRVQLLPEFPKCPVYSYESHILKEICCAQLGEEEPSFRLLGFTKSDVLVSIPSSSLWYTLRAEGPHPSANWNEFHLLAEVLGSEGQVAVLQHAHTQEEFVLKPFRDDPSNLWMLCLLLLPSATILWRPSSASEQQQATGDREEKLPDASYKQSTRLYWTDPHSVQTDLQKLRRLIKRPEKLDQFIEEVQRMCTYSIAFGYHDFAAQFADALERGLCNIPDQNRAQFQRTIDSLRQGGFQQAAQIGKL